jgi:hypothetical protein
VDEGEVEWGVDEGEGEVDKMLWMGVGEVWVLRQGYKM